MTQTSCYCIWTLANSVFDKALIDISQRKPSPVRHSAGKAKPGSRRTVLASSKPTLVHERCAVSDRRRSCDKALQNRLDASHLDSLSAGANEGVLSMFNPLLTNHIGQRTQRLSLCPSLIKSPLEEGQHQMEYGVPFHDRFVGLHSRVPQAQRLFQIPVIEFQGPAAAIPGQCRLCRQGQIGTQKVLRVLVPTVPSGDQYADIERDIAQKLSNLRGSPQAIPRSAEPGTTPTPDH